MAFAEKFAVFKQPEKGYLIWVNEQLESIFLSKKIVDWYFLFLKHFLRCPIWSNARWFYCKLHILEGESVDSDLINMKRNLLILILLMESVDSNFASK